MVQTRHQQEAQSDPPPPSAQRHRYATRSASRAESSDLGAAECGVCDDVSSRAPPPPSYAQKKKKTKQPPADDEDADADEQRATRRKAAAPALAPVVEEQEDDEGEGESESDDGGGDASSGDPDSADADADEEEAAMLQSLAASIEAAFKQKKTMAPSAAAPAAPSATAAAAEKSSSSESDDESDDPDADPDDKTKKIGLWQPSTGLKPAPPAARVALAHLGVDPNAALLRPSGVTAAAARAAPLDPKTAQKAARDVAKTRPDTAGAKWYDLPATAITDDVKRELRLLRLRGAYDPKRFYRSYDGGKFPRYFAVATVEDDPLEPSSSRLSRRERKRATITEQLLADVHLSDARKRRFDRLQEEAARLAGMGKSGERGLAAKRQRKSSLPRLPKSHHRKKH